MNILAALVSEEVFGYLDNPPRRKTTAELLELAMAEVKPMSEYEGTVKPEFIDAMRSNRVRENYVWQESLNRYEIASHGHTGYGAANYYSKKRKCDRIADGCTISEKMGRMARRLSKRDGYFGCWWPD